MEYVLRDNRRGNEAVLASSHVTFASSKIRRPPDLSTRAAHASRRGESADEPATTRHARDSCARTPEDDDPAAVATTATPRPDASARAAFEHYAVDTPARDVIPSGRVVLALCDVGVLSACDAERAGRLIAAVLGSPAATRVGGLTFAAFEELRRAVETKRASGALGTAADGDAAPTAPEFLENATLRATFDAAAARATATATTTTALFGRTTTRGKENGASDTLLSSDTLSDDDDDAEDDDGASPEERLLGMSEWCDVLDACGLLDDPADAAPGPGKKLPLSAAGAGVVFARARGATEDGDYGLRFAPDFVAALAWTATSRGLSFGEVAAKVMHAAPPPAPDSFPGVMTAEDFGASKGADASFDPDECFKYEFFDQRDDLDDTGLSSRAHSIRGGATAGDGDGDGDGDGAGVVPKLEALESLREAFRCHDDGHAGVLPASALVLLLGQAGAFDHLSLNTAAVFVRARLERLNRRCGELIPHDQFPGHVTLLDCGKHLRSILRFTPALRERRRTFAAPVRLTGRDKRPSDVAAMRRVFERYCAAGEEAGFAASAPPHPGLMDVQRWTRFARNADVFDVDFEVGAEEVAFALATPCGERRLTFETFARAFGYVAAQKGMTAADAIETVKRAKLSIGPAQSVAALAPGREVERGGASSSADGLEMPPSDADGAPLPPAPGMARMDPCGTFKRRTPLAATVADAKTAERVIRARTPAAISDVPLILADVGAFEGLTSVAAGACVAGACVSLGLAGGAGAGGEGAAKATRDDVVRITEALHALKKTPKHVDLTLPPRRALKVYEDHSVLRARFFEFSCFGLSKRAAERRESRLRATWQQSLIDADVMTCRERHEPYDGPVNQKPPETDCSRFHADEHAHTRALVEAGGAAVTAEALVERKNIPGGARKPDGVARAFDENYAMPPRFIDVRKSNAFGAGTKKEAAVAEEEGGGGGDDRPASAAAFVARAAAARERRIAAEDATKTPETLQREEIQMRTHRASVEAALAAKKLDEEKEADKTYAERRLATNHRAGLTQKTFRKLLGEAGVLSDDVTPASVDIIFARCRAPGSDVLTYGEYLRAIAHVAHVTKSKFGHVCGVLTAVGKPRAHYALTPRQVAAAGLTPSEGGRAHVMRAGDRAYRTKRHRCGLFIPKLSCAGLAESCERSHQNVLRRMKGEESRDEREREMARIHRRSLGIHHAKARLESAKRVMNDKDTWHFVKELEELRKDGHGLNWPGPEHSEDPIKTREGRALRESVTWLMNTVTMNEGGGVPELPMGVTVKQAAALIRADPRYPNLPSSAVDRRARDVVVDGVHGTRTTLPDGKTWTMTRTQRGSSRSGGSREDANREGSTAGSRAPQPAWAARTPSLASHGARLPFGSATTAVPATSLAFLRESGALSAKRRPPDPMAAAVRTLREMQANGEM